MADNSLSLLKQAFTETGVQLDRIIAAYEREKKPFIPTGFPAYVKYSIINDPSSYFIAYAQTDEYTIEILEKSGLFNNDSISTSDIDAPASGIYCFESNVLVYDLGINITCTEQGVDFNFPYSHHSYFDPNNSKNGIVNATPNIIKIEWVDPSTL